MRQEEALDSGLTTHFGHYVLVPFIYLEFLVRTGDPLEKFFRGEMRCRSILVPMNHSNSWSKGVNPIDVAGQWNFTFDTITSTHEA